MYAGVPIAIPADVTPLTRHRGAERFRDAEVGDQRVRTLREDVRRLDVAMDDAARVRKRERVDYVMQNPRHFARAELLLALERRAQRLAFDVRHRVPEQIALLAGREQRHDVRVLQLRGDLDLAAEPVAIDAGGELGRQHLDDDVAAEHAVDGDEDAAHAATGQLVIELIVGPQRTLEVLSEISHRSV